MTIGRSNALEALDLLKESEKSAPGVYDVFRLLKSMGTLIGAPHFSVFNISIHADKQLAERGRLSNWPPEMIFEYDRRRLFEKNPVIERLRRCTEPLFWSVETSYASLDDERRRTATDLFAEFGMERGICFPVHSADGNRGVVAFMGRQDEIADLEDCDTAVLAMFSQRCYNQIIAYSKAPDAAKQKHGVTARETECLKWTAMGKTSFEIGRILTISEHTVDNHLASASKKLNADNRTHAVWLAIQQNIIP